MRSNEEHVSDEDGVDCGEDKWNEKGTVEDSGEYKNINRL